MRDREEKRRQEVLGGALRTSDLGPPAPRPAASVSAQGGLGDSSAGSDAVQLAGRPAVCAGPLLLLALVAGGAASTPMFILTPS